MPSDLSDSPVHIYVLMGEAQSGPFTIDQIRGLWNQAAITSDAHYWHEGLERWEPLIGLMSASPEPLANEATANTWAHEFGDDGKCNKCGCTEQAASHFKFPCNSSSHAVEAQPRSDAHKYNVPQHLAIDTSPKKQTARTKQSGHFFGQDGKCRKCGCTQQAAEHFGFICKTISPSMTSAPLKPTRLGTIDWETWTWVGCIAACILSFIVGFNTLDNNDVAIPAILLGFLFFCISLVMLFSGGSATSRNLDPRKVTAAASMYTAYKAHQIHEELKRDSSDFGGL